ncbi:MAG: glycine cleavage system aminomethyltransferase GcvT [Bacteroidia bacterium]
MDKKTALYQKHIDLGAKMVPFAGYIMPVSYSGIKNEHQTVRSAVGIFDVSHMGEFIVEGKDAQRLVQYVTSNDVKKLEPGKAQYSCLPNTRGGIVDDLLVYCMGGDKYLLVVNASNIEKDWNWINEHNTFEDVTLKNISEKMSLMAVQGPKALGTLQELTPLDLKEIPYYHFKVGEFAGHDNVIISATGYTGSGGFEIYCSNNAAPEIWDAIMKAGEGAGIKPIGLGARDTLRLEMGFCLYGNDITDETSPLEAGLGWITKLKTDDFVGKDWLEAQKLEGTKNKLVAIEIEGKSIARQQYEIFGEDDRLIGEITSGTHSPSLDKPIALGYVDKGYGEPGTKIRIKVRNKWINAVVVKLPFYRP